MPKETIYGGEAFALEAKTGNEFPLLQIPPGTIYSVCQRGLSVHWGKDVDSIELGIHQIMTATGEHFNADGLPFQGTFERFDQHAMVRIIRTLKRASRQSFGDVPW